MAIKKLCQYTLLGISLLISLPNIAQNNFFGQVLQINTHFRDVSGKPTWLLIIARMQTGMSSPYVFDIRNQ